MFKGPKETVLGDSLNFDEQLKQIDICGLGPLRVTSALFNAGLLQPGSKVRGSFALLPLTIRVEGWPIRAACVIS